MPLASTASLQWYGPAAAAMVVDSAGSAVAQPVREIRPSVTVDGQGIAGVLRPYRGRYFAVDILGAGSVVAQPRKNIRPALDVSIGGTLTQDDVTGAVLESKVEGDLTLKQALRILLSHAAGDATGLEGASPEFKSLDGSKTRIAGTYSGGNRNVTTVDGT